MRYAIVDLEGAAREYFSTRAGVRDALIELEADDPGVAAEVYIVAYNDDRVVVDEPERGDELLRVPVRWEDQSTVPHRTVVGTTIIGASSYTTCFTPREELQTVGASR
jgi:hypothetical protein